MTTTKLYEDVRHIPLKDVVAKVTAYGLEYVHDEHAILLIEIAE